MATSIRSKLAVTITVAVIAVPLSARAAVLAQWHFDESTGASAADATGSFPGVLSGTGSSFAAGGIVGNAVSLDGAQNGYVSMGNVLPFATGDFSLVVWVNTLATQGVAAVAKHESFSENGYFIAINQTGGGGQLGKATFVASEFVAMGVTSTTSVNDGAWHQIVGVYHDGGDEEIYVDGVPVEATGASEPMVPNSAPFLIGAVNSSGTPQGGYTGLIDEVQVYDQALTASHVAFLYEYPAHTVPEPGHAEAVAAAALAIAAHARRRPISRLARITRV